MAGFQNVVECRARQNREPKDRVLSAELRAVLTRFPELVPRKEEFREFLATEFPGAGFRNSFLSELRNGEPSQVSLLLRFLAYLRKHHGKRLNIELDGTFSDSSVEELAARFVVLSDVGELRPRRNQDIITTGPAMVASELLTHGSRIEGASPIEPADIPTAASTLAIAVGDAFNDDSTLAPLNAASELGLDCLRLTLEEVCQMLSDWRNHCPMSVWFKRHSQPEKSLLSMAMPLTQKAYSEFVNGGTDEFSVLNDGAVPRSNHILLLTASGDGRSTRQGKLELMIMVLNQLSQIMMPLTKSETRIACPIHPGVLGKRAKQWGFRSTGAFIPRLGPTGRSKCFPPVVETGELTLPTCPAPNRHAVLWGLLFLWQCFYASPE